MLCGALRIELLLKDIAEYHNPSSEMSGSDTAYKKDSDFVPAVPTYATAVSAFVFLKL